MFRLRFWTAMFVAVAATLAGSATSQAGFTVTVSIDGSVVDTVNGDQDPITGLWSANFNKSYGTKTDFVSVGFSAQSNLPGTDSGGYVLDTTTNLTTGGTAGTAHEVVITATGTPFTAPGAAGDTLFLGNRLTIINPNGIPDGPNSSNLDVYAFADPDADSGTANSVRTDARSYSPSVVNGTTVYDTPTVMFTRGDNYSLGSVVDVTLQTGTSAQFTTTASVTATPAPSGLILVASGMSFFGLYRRLRRSVARPA